MKTLLAIALLSGILCLIPEAAGLLELHPAAGWDGALVWRAAGCHLVHFTGAHWFYDMAAMVILGLWLTEREVWRTLAIAVPVVALTVVAGAPELAVYRGLSGLDCALFAAAALKLLLGGSRMERWVAGIALTGFLLKTGWELSTGTTVFAGSGTLFEVVPLAHIAGAAAGFAAIGLKKWNFRRIVGKFRMQPINAKQDGIL